MNSHRSKLLQHDSPFLFFLQGLKMLYDFQKCHPEVDIKRFLSRSTKHFQQYVFEGLESLKNEKKDKDAFHGLNIPGLYVL